MRGTPKPTPAPSATPGPPQPAIVEPLPANINEDVEAAIEAGNNARDEKPVNYEEAERAYKVATQLAPGDPRAFEGLGNIYLDQGRNEDAVTAYRKAAELKTKNPQVYESLGDAYYRLGKYSEAIEASTQSLRLDPKPAGPYWTLTWVNLTTGDGAAAGNFANAFTYRWRPLFQGWPPYYVAFAGYLGFLEAGRNEDAKTLLSSAGPSADCKDSEWHCRILKYFRNEITSEQLIAEAKDNDKMTEARAYVGLSLALSGKRDEALTHLRWVVENGNPKFTEYPVAERWLKKLTKQ
jgi:lipoprotein NlpI